MTDEWLLGVGAGEGLPLRGRRGERGGDGAVPSTTLGTQLGAFVKTYRTGASLVVRWLRIRLPMRETWVRSLVQKDPTCHGPAKPMSNNY